MGSPSSYHTVTPYLLVDEVDRLTEFLAAAFGAERRLRLERKDGSIMHVEVSIGDSIVMLGEPSLEIEPMPASIYLSVEDCDEVYRRALAAGGTSVMEPVDMPHAGERYGGVRDPAGNLWWVATQFEVVSPEEQARRIEQGTTPRPEDVIKRE